MKEIVKHINDTNASYRTLGAGDAKNTDLFLDNEHFELFKDCGEQITVRFDKENLSKAILFIASILPRKYDCSATHTVINYSVDFVLEQLAILDGFFMVDGKSINKRTQVWNARKDVEKKNGEIDSRFYFNGLICDVLYSYKGMQKQGKFTLRNYLAGAYSDIKITKADDGIFDIVVTNAMTPNNEGIQENIYHEDLSANQPLQQIFYGAPGTGKSHEIQERTKGCDVIRTTFHPDSDYASFVGAYKPTMEHLPLTDEQGQIIKVANTALYKDQITYSFVKQAFLQAYLCAWKKYTEPTQIVNINYKQIFIDKCVELSSSTFPIEAKQKQGGTTTIIGIDSNNVIYHNNAQNNGSSKIDSDINLTMPIPPLAEAYSSIQGNINLLTSEKLREITKLPDITCGWAIINWVASQISRDQLLPKMSNATSPVYLIIEEINRGNCAQIFGDLFQLLDRQDNGFSTYPIQADGDMQKAIQKAFAQETDYKLNATLNVDGVVENYKSFSGKTLSEDIVNGDILLLPSNLYIWATMNTSDQSLFPIDSAFKRRWEWKYTRIAQGNKEDGTLEHWKLENDTDWWDFLKKINAIIDDMTQSADKQLGYYFCKPDKENDTISYARFVNKVLFYLWNDIFKTFSTDEYEQLFKIKRLKTDADGKWIEPHELEDKESKLTFPELYDEKGDVIPEIAKQFIEKVIAWGGKPTTENA